jgi:protein KRI1
MQKLNYFLSYILNRGWIDKSSRHIPTYKEVTSSIKSRSKAKAKSPTTPASESDSGLDSDASFESLNDHFEASYNFRFEEPGAATVQAFPRNLPDTVRRHDSTRKDARARRRERKEAEIEQKRQELGRLKNLKIKEIRQKLEKIGTEGGRQTNVDEDQGGRKLFKCGRISNRNYECIALQQLDLDADWDPDEHDRQMTQLYAGDVDAVIDEEKPTWEDDVDIRDIKEERFNFDGLKRDKKKKKKKQDEDEMDTGGVDIDEMDADVVREDDDDEEEKWDGTEEMRKQKLKEYTNKLDALNFNDVVRICVYIP